MAKDNAYYFSHDYNAHNDVKILFMRQQLGMEGYGIYWFLIENLADAGGFLPLKIVPVLAMQMHTTEVKVSAVIKEFELFELSDNQFFSARLNKHLEIRQHIKSINSEKGKKSAEARKSTAVQPQLNNGSTKESKGKEKKESKESKSTGDVCKDDLLKNSNLFRQPNKPTYEQVYEVFFRNGGTEEMARGFFNKHEGTGWFLNGSPIVNFVKLAENYIITFNKNKTEKNGTKSRADRHSEGLKYLLKRGEEEYAKVMAINQQNKTE